MVADTLFDLLFPPKCVLCGRVLEKWEKDLCRCCLTEVEEHPQGHSKLSFLDSWTAVWYYKGYIRGSIQRFKFRGARYYAPVYGKYLARKLLREHPEGFDVLTWIPISFLRKLTRGYDQVELLAEAVGTELGMEPVRTLRKIRHNRPQSGIAEYSRRKANALGAYRAVDPERIRGARVLMLDDVITTGATAGEAARTLLTAGAKEVHCGAVAAARNH